MINIRLKTSAKIKCKAALSFVLAVAMLVTIIPLSGIQASAASTDTLYIASTGNIDEYSYTAKAGITTIEVGYPYESDIISGPSEVTLTGFSKLIINQPTSDTVFKSINKLTFDVNFDRKNYDIKETQRGGYYLYSCKCYITRQIEATGNGTVTVSGNILAGCDNGVYYLAYDWNDNRRLDSYEEKNYTTTAPITVLNVSYRSHLTILSGEWNEINVEDGTDTIQEGGKIGTFTVTGILREYPDTTPGDGGGTTGGSGASGNEWTVRASVRFTQNGGRADKLTTYNIDAKYINVGYNPEYGGGNTGSTTLYYPAEQNGLHPIYFYLNAPAYNGLSPVGQAIIHTNYSSAICLGADFPNAYADTDGTPVLLGGVNTVVDARLYSFHTSTEKIIFTGGSNHAYVLLPDGFELTDTGNNFKAQQKNDSYTYNYTPIFSKPLTYMSEIDRDRVMNQTKITSSEEENSYFEFLGQVGVRGPLFMHEVMLEGGAYYQYLSITDKIIDAGIYYAAYVDWHSWNTPSFFYFEVAPAEVTITVNKNVSRKVGEMNLWDSDYYTATLSDGTDVTGKLPDKYLLTYLGKDQVGSGLDISLTQSISCDGNYHYTLVNGSGRLTIQNSGESTGETVPNSAVASIVSENGAGENGWYCGTVQLRAPDGYLISYKKDGNFTKSVVYSGSSSAPQTVSYYLKLNNGGNVVSALKDIREVKLCNIADVAAVNLNGTISGTGTSRTATLNITRNATLYYQYGLWKLYAMVADSTPSYADVINDANLVYTHNVNPESVSVTFNNLGAGRTYSIYYVTISSSGVRSDVTAVNGSSFTTEKIAPTLTTSPKASAASGTKLKDIAIIGGVVSGSDGKALTGSWAWTDSADFEKVLSSGNTTAYSATFTPDSSSYTSVTTDIVPIIAYEAPASVNGVYQIKTVNDLMWFAALVNGDTALTGGVAKNAAANACLTANINLNGAAWTTISSFAGTLDGKGFTISAQSTKPGYFTEAVPYKLFIASLASGGTVKNLTLSNQRFWPGSDDCGGIVGTNAGTIENCIVDSPYIQYSGWAGFGGVAGSNNATGIIRNCAVIGGTLMLRYGASNNPGGNSMGGICGINYGKLENCYLYNTALRNGVTQSAIVYSQSPYTVVKNCYYYSNPTYPAGSASNGGTELTAAQFASGEAAYLLNGGKTDGTQVWYQNIDNGKTLDATPKFTGGTVYSIDTGYSNTNSSGCVESANTEKTTVDMSSRFIVTTLTNNRTLDGIFNTFGGFTATASYSFGTATSPLYGTGSVISFNSGGVKKAEYTLIVMGDIDGDSVCDALDCLKAQCVLSGNASVSGAYLKASDINDNGDTDIYDYQQIVNKSLNS